MNSNEMALFIEAEYVGRGHVGIADAASGGSIGDDDDR